MRLPHPAVATWADQLDFRESAGWKLLSAAPWVAAFLRAEFTSAAPRVALEAFHASLDTFLKQLRADSPEVPLNDAWRAAQYADSWVKAGFLARPLVDGFFVYEPTAHTARVLRFLDSVAGSGTNLNSSRLSALLSSLESLAHETDPDPEARIRQLESEIADRRARLDALRSGEAPAMLSDDGAVAAARSILDLAANLPADFKRMRDGVQEMLHGIRQEIMESSVSKGVAVGQVLEGDRQLRSTPEGETFRGFTDFLNDPAQQARFREAVTEVLARGFVDDLTAGERHTIANMLRELRRQATEVHATYGKLSESLHAYVQSDELRESEQLRRAIRAAELATAASPALRPRTPVAPLSLYEPHFATLADLGIFDPAEHVAPPKLADPPPLSAADIHRTPITPGADTGVLRAAVVHALESRTTAAPAGGGRSVTLGEVFETLEPQHRHLNSVRYLIELARITDAAALDTTDFQAVDIRQVDGSERTAYLPRVTYAPEFAAAHGTAATRTEETA
ncbi:DUF3375 domain-containing protein [Zhihengliuella halotolerans]|uniref:Uncharacterized protein DUF3375 n=1 Tax=Zhihengliuella halotolerans TaxID=370736 RepID=A0A4V2GAB1_9MICC|nr:DUF3375 domain-containing protein [Zhihengliuella halotolerans]RZU63576.1 uncharacterized protein DUF3375 [Zhihengliuella halotolerans]